MKIRSPWRAAFGAVVLSLAAGSRLGADVVLEWNEVLHRGATRAAPEAAGHVHARVFAMTHLAMATATSGASAATRDPTLRVALERAAAATAASDVLEQLLPAMADECAALAARQLGALGPALRAQGERIGRLAAARVLQARERDGWLALAAFGAGSALSPDNSLAAVNALARGDPPERSPWLALTPFVLRKVGQFEPRPAFSVNREGEVLVDSGLRQARLFNAIDRSQRADVLQITWSDDPVLAWNRIVRAALAAAPRDAATEARVFATLNLALADARVAALHWRFTLGSWRTITVDRWEELDGKAVLPGDVIVSASDGLNTRSVRHRDGRLLIPPQRDFPSVAATLAGAAQAALAGCWKTDRVTFSLPVMAPAEEGAPVVRTFTAFSDAAREAAFVASLDGRHSREACVSGYQLGAAIGAYAAKRQPTLPR